MRQIEKCSQFAYLRCNKSAEQVVFENFPTAVIFQRLLNRNILFLVPYVAKSKIKLSDASNSVNHGFYFIAGRDCSRFVLRNFLNFSFYCCNLFMFTDKFEIIHFRINTLNALQLKYKISVSKCFHLCPCIICDLFLAHQ